MTRRHSRQGGFSLIEVMIVLVIMGVITAQMFMAFAVQKRVYLKTDRALDVQESGAHLFMPRLHEERGELALLREDHASFEIEFQAAHELDVEMGSEARARRLAERLESEAESWASRTRAGSSGRRS